MTLKSNYEQNERFLFVMAALAEASGQEAGEFKIKLYAQMLDDLTIEQIERAAKTIINTRTFSTFPKIAEIRESVFGSLDDKAQIAISKIETAMQKYGTYHSVKFDDPIIHAVITSHGGWVKVCEVTEADWQFLRKDFIKLYKAFSNTHPAHLDIPDVLEGIHGADSNKAMLATIGREVEVKTIGGKIIKQLEGK